MNLEDVAKAANGAEVFISGLVGGLISWLAGDQKHSFRHAVLMVLGGAFAAEYLTTAILQVSGYDLPDRAVGFLVGVLSMRATDVLVEVLEQSAKNPRYLLDLGLDFISKRFLKK